jgi:hypothetical protein
MNKTKVTFDERRILVLTTRGSNNALRRAGAYVRKAAMNKIKHAPDGDDGPQVAAPPGAPPYTHTRSGGLLKRSILFGVDKRRNAALVGPAYSLVGPSMTAHEYGGNYRGRKYPRRPLMGPTLKQTAGDLPKLWKNAVK